MLRLRPKPYIIFLIYTALVALATIGMSGSLSILYKAIFLSYALFIWFALWPKLSQSLNENDQPGRYKKISIALLISAVLFFIVSRLLPFIRYGATPLGYDTGFYWQYFDLITHLGTSKNAILSSRLAYVPWFPYYFIGLPALSVINFFHLTHQALTLGAFYFLIKSLPKRILTSYTLTIPVGIVLFSLSINQFMAFSWMFYKQSMAIPFLLFALGLFLRRSWLAIPIASFAAAVHIETAIPFGLALTILLCANIATSIIKKRPLNRETVTLGASILAVGLLVLMVRGVNDIKGYLDIFLTHNGLTSTTATSSWDIPRLKGLFIPISTFLLNAIFYIPFGILGLITSPWWLLRRSPESLERTLSLPILGVISLILSSFPFIYQNRSLVILDVMLLLFTLYPITLFFTALARERIGRTTLGLLFCGFILFSSLIIIKHPPAFTFTEAKEIQTVQKLKKSDDYMMATSATYTPWVFAYTKFDLTIAPGWLHWNKWSIDMWKEFWDGSNDAKRLQMLSLYGNHDIYMFFGEHQIKNPNLQQFLDTNSHIKKISPHIWRYSP